MNTKESWDYFNYSKKYLAGGSSTCSKVPEFPYAQPAIIQSGKGCRVWDIDGNEYIDFRNALGPITLGYCIPEIDEAIRGQLNSGIVFSYPHRIEGQLAEKLVKLIPCAERVRFLKTGGEACSACIKLARAKTKRDIILQCGYNGWLNSLDDGSFRPANISNCDYLRGIPSKIQELHHTLPWGDIEKWERIFCEKGDDIAAVISSCSYPEIEQGSKFLPGIRELTLKYGSLMIMDEIVTGFRIAIGGAHEYFDFTPDLAIFSKGMANGMPISAYLGRADIMDNAGKIGISSTFGGETLSLAAANACLNFYEQNDVVEHLWQMGKLFWPKVNELLAKYGFSARFKGFEVCPMFVCDKPEERVVFFKVCFSAGLLLYRVSYVSFSHEEKDINEALGKMERALESSKDL